ncbi:MAG: hypothetical protein NZ740_01785 [Kiritimatiellae bacterium]|nr:hypothetical protein [Kiritimatiellia bacterium]MDW8457822.1 hypothetical protein [Verrucomicrobiota bacterium]
MNFLRRSFTIMFACLAGWLSALEAPGYTLLVAPARYSVIQVAQDVLQRVPAVLVAYQGNATTAEPILHAWNGTEWVPITLKDFREVNFLQKMPSRTILIGSDDVLPKTLMEASSWSPRLDRITDMTTGALINDLGRLLDWGEDNWVWFARRYNLTLVDEAAPRRSRSWFDQAGPLPDRPRLGPIPGIRPVKPVASEPAEPPPAPVADAPSTEPAP